MSQTEKPMIWPTASGRCAALVRELDWGRTELGEIGDWSPSLRVTVDTLLRSTIAMALLAGRKGILIYNDAYSMIAGPRHPAIYGLPVAEAWPEVADFTRGIIDKCARGESVCLPDQLLPLNRRGVEEECYFDIDYGPVVDERGEPVGALVVVVETTRRVMLSRARAAEQEASAKLTRQSAEMEAVGQLTGGIAHEFNNLLQGIIGSLEVVRVLVDRGRPAEVPKFLDASVASAHRAASLTDRLLAFARRQPLDPKPVDVNRLIASMEDMLRKLVPSSVRVELSMGAGLWLTRCDANQVENAILNLVLNARDAMPHGGSLAIETANTHLDRPHTTQHGEVSAGEYICITVTDSGTGMPADVLLRAFDPFFTTKPTGQGTGLGLSMVCGFARQSQGDCKIYSEEGKGTSVKLYLPRYRILQGAAPNPNPIRS